MNFLFLLELFNYGLVLIFGLFLSTFIAGGWENKQQRNWIVISCPFFLLLQAVCWFFWGTETVEELYPLIVHLPLTLILVLPLKKRFVVAFVSVLTAYLCCEIPLWFCFLVTALSNSALLGEICYTLSIIFLYFLLHRYFIDAARDTITGSSKTMLLFGGLPLAYYIFDYIATVYSDVLYSGIYALNEFLPTILVVFYVLFLTAYHGQQQKRAEAEFRHSMLESELKQSETVIANLRRAEKQTAIYQHDMRHHLLMIENFLSVGKISRAEDYIKRVHSAVESITPQRFCENEPVNLITSSFAERTEKLGILFRAEVKLPKEHGIPDTELCAVLSNGLENALHAVKVPEVAEKWMEFCCVIRHNKLLIEIKNPYAGEISFADGLPLSDRHGHGYGCHSIRTIAQQHKGLCTFEAENGIFTLRVALPI